MMGTDDDGRQCGKATNCSYESTGALFLPKEPIFNAEAEFGHLFEIIMYIGGSLQRVVTRRRTKVYNRQLRGISETIIKPRKQ